jgi:RNA polymerase sigma-70 factor, ECF subfamily
VSVARHPSGALGSSSPDMPDHTELSRLLTLIAAGDKTALSRFYELTAKVIFGRINFILRDRTLAEDALQEVYLSVWQYAGSFDPGFGSPMTWLGSIARNQAFRVIRASRGHLMEEATALDPLAAPGPSPLEDAMASADLRALKACLGELDPGARRALLLAFFGGHSYAEVARLLGEPEGSVKSRIRRSLAKLKQCLDR